MKITIDKSLTTVSFMPTIREKIKDFKAYFTEYDLLRMFTEEFGYYVSGDIIKCDVEAFQANSYSNEAHYMVSMIVDELVQFTRISFFIHAEDGTYSINPDKNTVQYRAYKSTKGA